MERVNIETAQNVDIEYELAGIGDRILAVIIDALIISAYLILTMFPVGFLIQESDSTTIIVSIILLTTPALFYDLICEVAMNGQSFGKKLMKIKVARLDGSQPTLSGYLLRWFVGIIEKYSCYGVLGLITILINGKGQRLGDMAGGTTVIKLRNKVTLEDTIFAHQPLDYTVVYPEAASLNDEDISIVQEVLQRYRTNRHSRSIYSVLHNAALRVEAKMGIRADSDSLEFLKTVVRDYNALGREE